MTKKKDEEVTLNSYKLTKKGIRKTTKKVAYEETPLAKVREWEREKKAKTFERLCAVSRHPEYMAEYKKLKELDGTYPEIELQETYKEKYKAGKRKPVYVLGKDYQKFQVYLKENTEYQKKLLAIRKRVEKNRLEKTDHKDEMIRKWKVEELPRLWFPNYIKEPQSQYPDKFKPAVVELENTSAKITNPLESGYLYLQIDLSKARGLIDKEIKKIVGKYHKITNPQPRRDSKYGCQINPWEVYDMRHRGDMMDSGDKMSLISIARKLFGKPGMDKADADYGVIRRAYKHAKSEIAKVI